MTAGEINLKIGFTNAKIARLEELNHKARECERSIKEMAKSFVNDRNRNIEHKLCSVRSQDGNYRSNASQQEYKNG